MSPLRPCHAHQGRPTALSLPTLQPPVRTVYRACAREEEKRTARSAGHGQIKIPEPVRLRPIAGLRSLEFRRHSFQRGNPERMPVQAWNLREILSSRRLKRFTTANADFLQRLQAVRNEGGTEDQQLFHAAFRQFSQFKIGVRLQPRVPTQPGLE